MRSPTTHLPLQQVVNGIYDAALEPGLWPEVIADVAKYGQSSFALMSWRDKDRSQGGPALRVETQHSEMVDRYFEGPIATDPILRSLLGPLDVGYLNNDLEPRQAFLKSERYARFLRPCDVEDRVCILAMNQSDEQSVILTLGRGRLEDPYSRRLLAPLQELSPHIRRAIQVTYRFRRDAERRESLLASYTRAKDGVFFVDASRVVISINAEGEELLTRKVLTVHNGRLRTAVAEESAALDRLLQKAVMTGQRADTDPGGAVVLHRTDGTVYATAGVSPLRTANICDGFGAKPVCAAVFVREHPAAKVSGQDAMRTRFGFTPAETRVARDLVQGLRLQEIADRHGLRKETVRSQLKALFDKTGARRQSQLIKVLLTGTHPPQLASDSARATGSPEV